MALKKTEACKTLLIFISSKRNFFQSSLNEWIYDFLRFVRPRFLYIVKRNSNRTMYKPLRQISMLAAVFLLEAGILSSQAQQIKPTSSKEMQEAFAKHQEMFQNSSFKNYPIRNIGPTNMSGRVTDIEVSSDYKTYYIAAASGGVWKTEDNGQSFTPIFDHQGTLGMGDMAIAPSNDNIIWVGTGENNSSRSTYAGNGVYKSTDAGKTWEFVGFPHSQHIGQIQIHPTNPDIVWVGAMGSLYSKNDERGLYKTIDGGKTWKRTLFVDNNTGVIDIKVQPGNPNVLLAATWERLRMAYDFIGNGKGSAIWRSEDGGDTWTKAMEGFPQDEFVGRIGFDFSLSSPTTVYALHDYQKSEPRERRGAGNQGDNLTTDSFKSMTAEAVLQIEDDKLNRFLRSNRFASKYDAASVKKLIERKKITPIDIANYNSDGRDANADIINSTVVGAEVYRSDDAGKSWKKVNEPGLDRVYNSYGYYFGEVRTSTSNPDELFILGVPLMVSRDGGKTFANTDSVGNVHSDHQSMWINPKDSKHILLGTDGGLYVSYGNGERWTHLNDQLTISQFYSIMVDEATPYNVYGGMQDNGVWYGKSTNRPSERWNSLFGGDGMVVAVDTRSNDIVYTGSQFGNYYRINTTTGERKYVTPGHDIGNKPNRWNWRTPATLSKHNQDIFYMGSQYVYRSLDRGDTWETISPDLTKGPREGNVPFATLTVVEESPLEFGTLYAGSDDGNIWNTRNHGKAWIDISKGLPQNRWISSITPSQHVEGLVYVTLTGYRNDEFTPHVYKSTNYGTTWTPIAGNLPTEAMNVIREDHLHPDLLYIGSDHGLYITMDGGKNYELIQGNIPNVSIYDMVIQKKENDLVIGSHGRSVFIMDLNPIYEMMKNKGAEISILNAPDTQLFQRRGAPSMDAMFYTSNSGEVQVTIKNSKGEAVKSWTENFPKGFNQVSWDLRPESGNPSRGKFSIELSKNGQTSTKEFEIK
ncbi:Sortilin, neurotensin receptor 3 [Belliella pelovolcani]|uniref:Sortilin, neurotensin receptor 3 n=2 Tax=Belliella pelovolcani TaxID=529505 RepID=A0A1N7M9R4_9BACT|nr:Sortilin, neurotensin receptor 3 [Belliella pelovolcani]